MHRQALLKLLSAYQPAEPDEKSSLQRIAEFVRRHSDCFERSLSAGHITASGWLVDRRGDRVLLTCHRKLGKWLQLGGHADGDPDVLAVALREAREESGIEDIVPIREGIFDLDVHEIPARNGVPTHNHYDIRFLLQAHGPGDYRISDESLDLRWLSAKEVPDLTEEESMLRMYRKWLRLIPVMKDLAETGRESALPKRFLSLPPAMEGTS